MTDTTDTHLSTSRRRLLYGAFGAMAPVFGGPAAAQSIQGIVLPRIAGADEADSSPQEPAEAPAARVGFAVVGLGHLTLERLMPAFGKTKHCRPVALVSGDRAKAQVLARQHGIQDEAIYGYDTFDRLADNPEVQVVYIVLPNGQHAEFTQRAAKAGKHVLCEKPMANTAAECQQMIDACRRANVKLMVAYRSQYEPHNRAIVDMVQRKELGTLKAFLSTNSQNMGDPAQWRLKKSLAGGGALPDVGIYCLNTARFLSNEEPSEVIAWTHSTPGDPRFREVEESVQFLLRFPSGFEATCHTSYGIHKSQNLRLMGSDAWVELSPAYAYEGIRMRRSRKVGSKEITEEPVIGEKDQFALEMDHMAECVRTGREPLTGGPEGLQDQRIVEAIYASARAGGKAVALKAPAGRVRGPDLKPVA